MHELDMFLPLPGSSVVAFQELNHLIKLGAFTQDVEEDELSEITDIDEDVSLDDEDKDYKGNESDNESKSSFTSSVEYPYSFCEVSFLLHKLYQCANKRFDLKSRNVFEELDEDQENISIVADQENKKTWKDEVAKCLSKVERKKLLLNRKIEKLSRMHAIQLEFLSVLSNVSRSRWLNVVEKVVKSLKEEKKHDKDLLVLRVAFLQDMTEFINNEIEQFVKQHGPKKVETVPSKNDKKIDINVAESVLDTSVLKANRGYVDKGEDATIQQKEHAIDKAKKKDLETKPYTIDEKEAFGME